MVEQHTHSPSSAHEQHSDWVAIPATIHGTGSRIRSAMNTPGKKKDFSVWADIVWDRYAESIPRSVTHIEREKIPKFLEALQTGMSWKEAAEMVDFRSGDDVICPPTKMARIVMMSFLEGQPNGKDMLKSLETLHPEKMPASLVIHPQWKRTCEKQKDFGGRVRSMDTANAKLIGILRDNDNGITSCTVDSSISDAKLHQQALDKVVDALTKGELNIFDFSATQKAGLKVEPGSSQGKYLVCLHTHAESRIYGVYDTMSGSLTWRGLIDSHRKWTQFIKNFKA